MVALITDPDLEERLIAQRRATGGDRYDEVWEGVYVMSPLANNEHQGLVNRLAYVLTTAVELPRLGRVFPGVNVSDRLDDWKKNYRCPDVAVFLRETHAVDRGTHWYGGPDFAIEIVSPGDRSWEKLPFYEKVGTPELLIVDRDPWRLTLHRLAENRFVEVGLSTAEEAAVLTSEVLPLTWRLRNDENDRPQIEISHTDGKQHWTVSGAG